jgi:hypothetical protein
MFIRFLILVFHFFSLDCVLWYGGMSTEYVTLLIHPLISGRHVFGVRGSCLPPPPVTRPPPGEPYFLEYCVITCAHIKVT